MKLTLAKSLIENIDLKLTYKRINKKDFKYPIAKVKIYPQIKERMHQKRNISRFFCWKAKDDNSKIKDPDITTK